jgi:hypothetical protein
LPRGFWTRSEPLGVYWGLKFRISDKKGLKNNNTLALLIQGGLYPCECDANRKNRNKARKGFKDLKFLIQETQMATYLEERDKALQDWITPQAVPAAVPAA